MLRNWVLGIGVALLAAAALVLILAWPFFPAAIWLAIVGLAMTLGVLYERRGDTPLAERAPGPDWVETGERFTDPETGKLVAVYHHPRTGERRYVGR
jgi:hypothetical protein